jgi:hypothetical protein
MSSEHLSYRAGIAPGFMCAAERITYSSATCVVDPVDHDELTNYVEALVETS